MICSVCRAQRRGCPNRVCRCGSLRRASEEKRDDRRANEKHHELPEEGLHRESTARARAGQDESHRSPLGRCPPTAASGTYVRAGAGMIART
jgi:hypothetical protein